MIFGRRDLWAFEVNPLAGAPAESDPAAAATWCSLRIWVNAKNLSAHTRTDTLYATDSLHWPAAYLARWFLNSWDDLWNRAGSPLPGASLDPEHICTQLDARVVELADHDDDAADAFLEQRDAFVASHSLLAAAGGGVMPHVYLLREGESVHIVWREPESLGGIRFHEPRGRFRIDARVFLDAVREFLCWVREATKDAAPQLVADIDAWLERVDGPLAAHDAVKGYALPWGTPPGREISSEDLEGVLELPPSWQLAGAAIEPSKYPVAVVFRALSPVLEVDEVLRLVQRLRATPLDKDAARKLEAVAKGLPRLGIDSAYQQGYRIAEEFRRRRNNPDRFLDIEELLSEYGVRVQDEELGDRDIEAATVWDEAHGPFILVNSRSRRTSSWARRMTLAHELCHLLVDRENAAPLLIASTPWAPPEMERRANAFAAELLLPKAGILRVAKSVDKVHDEDTREELMREFGVGETVCIRHTENRFGGHGAWDS